MATTNIGKFTLQGSHLYLEHLFRGQQKAQHTPYIGLFLTTPTQQGPGSEPSGGGYQRAVITTDIFSAPSLGVITTVEDIIFSRSTGWTGTVIGAGLFDSSVAGRCLVYWDSEDIELIEDKDRMIILAGGLTHQFVSGLWSNYLKDLILNDLYRSVALPLFASTYLATYTTAPTATAGGTEPADAAYVRQPIANNSVNFTVPASGEVRSSQAFQFPFATAAQGSQTHWGLHTSATGGQYLLGGTITPAKTVDINDQLEFAAGDLRVSLDKVA